MPADEVVRIRKLTLCPLPEQDATGRLLLRAHLSTGQIAEGELRGPYRGRRTPQGRRFYPAPLRFGSRIVRLRVPSA